MEIIYHQVCLNMRFSIGHLEDTPCLYHREAKQRIYETPLGNVSTIYVGTNIRKQATVVFIFNKNNWTEIDNCTFICLNLKSMKHQVKAARQQLLNHFHEGFTQEMSHTTTLSSTPPQLPHDARNQGSILTSHPAFIPQICRTISLCKLPRVCGERMRVG